MPIYKLITLYLATTPVFLAIDFLWLGLIARSFYAKQLGNFFTGVENWGAAVLFYLIFIVGIMIFAVLPAIENASLLRALVLGALFGFFCYATYDLTNYATLKNWPLIVVVVDILWGIFITATTAAISFLIATKILS